MYDLYVPIQNSTLERILVNSSIKRATEELKVKNLTLNLNLKNVSKRGLKFIAKNALNAQRL